ncbi:MAG: RimK/LysX family protein [Planctomycetota bacterium]
MTNRDQTPNARRLGSRVFGWLVCLFVALAPFGTPSERELIAQETADSTDAKPLIEDAAADSSESPPAEQDAAAEGKGGGSAGQATNASDNEAKSSDEKQNSQQQDASAEPASSQPDEEDKASTEEESAAESDSQPEPTIEEERTMEVEPPPAEKEASDDKQEPPKKSEKEKCIIGATATLIEKQSGIKFRARVDSGAKSCSLHVEKTEIQNGSTKENITERMTENVGKVISFVVKNGDGKTHILKRKIAGYVIIKTSDKSEGKRRYKVPLTFLWKNMEKEVLVTLNDRRHMDYPLLIGRNFLRDDFLIDVSLNSDDKPK